MGGKSDIDQLSFRIKLDDKQAFELLFRRYYTQLCLFANKFLNDPEEAREIVQDVFVRIWENRDQIDPSGPVKAYLYRITQNMSISKLRKRKVESAYNEIYRLVYVDNHEFSALETMIGKELETNIAASVEKLPKECRKVFELSRIEGLKYREIADTLNISIKTVEAHMSKALKVLYSELAEHILILTFLIFCSRL